MTALPHIGKEELQYCLDQITGSDTAEYAIKNIDTMIEFLKDWRSKMQDQHIEDLMADNGPCHKDDPAFHEKRGS